MSPVSAALKLQPATVQVLTEALNLLYGHGEMAPAARGLILLNPFHLARTLRPIFHPSMGRSRLEAEQRMLRSAVMGKALTSHERSMTFGGAEALGVKRELREEFLMTLWASIGLKPDGVCDLVPLPPPSLVERFTSSEALASVDAAKLKAFDELWGPTLKALPKTPTAICLPPPAKLDALALAQADLGKSFGADEVKQLDKAGTILKSAITPAKAFPLIGDAQKQTMGASLPERQRFKATGAQVETAAKLCTALPRKPECAL